MGTSTIVILLLIGLTAGILSGLVGIGGGIIIVPALVYFLGFSQHAAQGTSLGLLLPPVGILAVMNYYKKGFLDINVVLIMAIAFVVGAFLGSKFSINLSEDKLKKFFAVVLLLIAGKMLLYDK
jgi:uncharacterized membrane protein YfcA